MISPFRMSHAWNREYWPAGGARRAFLLLELQSNTGRAERAPMNISLVLDRGGSMNGNPIHDSKKECRFVNGQPEPGDQLSLVDFDNKAIRSGGGTSLSEGLLQGVQYVVDGKTDGSVNRVIVISDGYAGKEGEADGSKLQSIAKEAYSLGVGITTIGIGDGFDEELLESIADQSGGSFYFSEKPEHTSTIFSRELEGLLSVVAQNVRLTIRPSDSTQITYIYGYQAEESSRGIKVLLGDVFDQEVKSVLIECSFRPHTAGTHKPLEIQWDYTDVTEEIKTVTMHYSIEAQFTDDSDTALRSTNTHVEKQVKITESATAVEQALTAFDEGDEERGKMLLQRQGDTLLAYAVQSDDAELREEAQMLYSRLENFIYSSQIRKSLHERKYRQLKRKG